MVAELTELLYQVTVHSLALTYTTFLGFMVYVSAKQSWDRLKFGIKLLLLPAITFFGILDVLFNATVGSLLFLALPRELTFSQRLNHYVTTQGWRGSVARAFAVPLNAISPNHIK